MKGYGLMVVGERLTHVLEAQQFSRGFLEEELFPHAQKMEPAATWSGRGFRKSLQDKIVTILFAEPSTRTRVSFETAVLYLGGHPLSTENAAEFSSLVKGESIEDTVRVICGYGHSAIVMRHKEEGASHKAAAVSTIPIINAGDGTGQHPTQALLDGYTIQKELGRINGLSIAMVGDLKYDRTVNSLAYILGKFDDIHIDFVSPPEYRIKQGIKDYLDREDTSYTEGKSLLEAVRTADVVYMTRPQLERHKGGNRLSQFVRLLASRIHSQDGGGQYSGDYRFSLEALNELPEHSIIMHPLPRNDEIPKEIDNDPRAAYFRQSDNGLPIRMALLDIVAGR